MTISTNATKVTTIAIMPKGMKVKFLGNIEENCELNHNALPLCKLSKGHISNMLGAVWCLK